MITNTTIRAFLHAQSVQVLKKGSEGSEKILGIAIQDRETFPYIQIPGISFQIGVPEELNGHVKLFSFMETIGVLSYQGLRRNGTYTDERYPDTVARVSEVKVDGLSFKLLVQGKDLGNMQMLADVVLSGTIRPSDDQCAEQVPPLTTPAGGNE